VSWTLQAMRGDLIARQRLRLDKKIAATRRAGWIFNLRKNLTGSEQQPLQRLVRIDASDRAV
jgi:hypothetical protein